MPSVARGMVAHAVRLDGAPTPEAAAIANEAGVGLLVYYHLSPAPDNFLMRRLFASGVNAVRADDWTIAEDGSLYTLPLDSQEIHIGRIDERAE